MKKNFGTMIGVATLVVLSACASQKAPEPIHAEPVFDKYGNPSCRPFDTPVGGIYTADLPLCSVPPSVVVNNSSNAVDGSGGTATGDTGTGGTDTPTDDPGQNQNNNQNQSNTQNQNNNQNNNRSGS